MLSLSPSAFKMHSQEAAWDLDQLWMIRNWDQLWLVSEMPSA